MEVVKYLSSLFHINIQNLLGIIVWLVLIETIKENFINCTELALNNCGWLLRSFNVIPLFCVSTQNYLREEITAFPSHSALLVGSFIAVCSFKKQQKSSEFFFIHVDFEQNTLYQKYFKEFYIINAYLPRYINSTNQIQYFIISMG